MRQLIFILLAIIGVSQAQTIQYIGAPTTTVISRGNFRTDSIFYLPKRTKLPTDTAALRYQISDSSLYAWTGSQWRKVGADADTLVYSTRAWRQKGDDSLAARINLKVNISDTASMLAPYLRKSDTTAMLSPYYRSATASAALALKLNISDTATMLSPYYRSATATSALATKLNISDTASMLSPYYKSATASAALATKLNISDTSTMLSPYARTATVNASLATKLNISDTSSMLGNYVRHAGYGLTKSGQSFLVDTLNIATRAWRQKGIDSVRALIPAAGVGGSGTTNYVSKFTASGTIGNSQIFDNGTSVGIGETNPGTWLLNIKSGSTNKFRMFNSVGSGNTIDFVDQNWQSQIVGSNGELIFNTGSTNERLRIFANGRVGINTTTDAGDYKLQVVGKARIGTGVLDIAANDIYGITTSRSGTSVIAHQIFNSNGILYLGAENSTGGGIFSGSSAYAAVIGSGANYPLQFATNNTTRATITNDGNFLIGTTTNAEGYKLQVNGYISATQVDITGSFFSSGTGANLYLNGTTNGAPVQLVSQSLTGSNASAMIYGGTTWNTTGSPSLIDISVTNTASGSNANFIKISDGPNTFRITKDAGIITSNPTSGTAKKWKLGSVVNTSVDLDTGKYVEVEIDGTFYRLAIVTPL